MKVRIVSICFVFALLLVAAFSGKKVEKALYHSDKHATNVKAVS